LKGEKSNTKQTKRISKRRQKKATKEPNEQKYRRRKDLRGGKNLRKSHQKKINRTTFQKKKYIRVKQKKGGKKKILQKTILQDTEKLMDVGGGKTLGPINPGESEKGGLRGGALGRGQKGSGRRDSSRKKKTLVEKKTGKKF